MSEQKFKRGNKVRVLSTGKEAIIFGSYRDQFGGGNIQNFTILYCDTGQQMSWMNEDNMELIDNGGEFLIDQANLIAEEILKQHTDLDYILKHWRKHPVSSDTILYLFERINFKSNFLENGEYYALFDDWDRLYPTLAFIIKAKSEEEAVSMLTESASDETRKKIISLYNDVSKINIQQLN